MPAPAEHASASNPGPAALLERYRGRLGITAISGTQALRSLLVNIGLGALVDMAVGPQFQIARKSLQAFFPARGGSYAGGGSLPTFLPP